MSEQIRGTTVKGRAAQHRIIQVLKALPHGDPDGVTGLVLAERLGAPNTTISGDIRVLRAEGFPIGSGPQGYYLKRSNDHE